MTIKNLCNFGQGINLSAIIAIRIAIMSSFPLHCGKMTKDDDIIQHNLLDAIIPFFDR